MKQKKSIRKKLVSLILAVILVIASMPLTVLASNEINIDNEFKDEMLKEYVIENIDTDNDGFLSEEECLAVKTMDISSLGVKDVSSLKYFTALEVLDCSDNFITCIYLPELTNLKELYASYNNIGSNGGYIYVGKQLEVLHISHNVGTDNIEFSTLWPNLIELDCSYSGLAWYSFSKILNNTKLEKLNCEGLGLTSLDVSNMQNLVELYCSNNALASLDLSKNPNLKVVECKNNKRTITLSNGEYWSWWELTNFDHDRASNWQGATYNDRDKYGNKSYSLTNFDPVSFDYEVTYTYDLGNGMSETFTLVYGVGGNTSNAELTGYTVDLDGDIRVNFNMKLSDEIANSDTAYMAFTFSDGLSSKVYVKDIEPTMVNGVKQYVFPCHVPAKEMVCDITANFYDGDKVSETYTYTVKDYSEYILKCQLSNNEYGQATDVVKSMLNYGAYAQLYFTHNHENLAHDSKYITTAERKKINSVTADDLESSAIVGDQSNEVFSFYGSNLSLKSKTIMRLYFKISSDADIDNLQFTCNDEVLKYGKSGNLYYVDISNIAPQDLDEIYTVTVSDGNYKLDVNYTAMSYCYVALKTSSNANLKNAVKAIYLYNQAANEYFE
jgi:hypothetical protein